MDMKFDVIYEVKERESWRGKEGIKIQSNIAGDELVECDISKSLVEYIKKESAILKPDQIILGFAEAQRRGIEDNLKSLDDVSLRVKNLSEESHKRLMDSYNDLEEKYYELEKKFNETKNRFQNNIQDTSAAINEQIKSIDQVSEKLSKVDNYGLERLVNTLNKVIELVNSDKEIVRLVLDMKK